MEEEKTVGLVETFDTGELSTELIPPNFTDPDDLFLNLEKRSAVTILPMIWR